MKSLRKKLPIIFGLFILTLIGMDMYNSKKAIWFEGSNEIDCNINTVKNSVVDLGNFFTGIVSHMPSMTSVDLVEQGEDFVTIQTNEGLMKRTNISKKIDGERVLIEFDEEYKAGNAITTHSHIVDEFEVSNNKVIHRFSISNLKAPGFMGFFYRNFGSSSMGNAFLAAYKIVLEKGEDEKN